ncbi:MAG: hypothetical protein ABI898_08015 [Sphingomonadales bacterium]
MKTHAPNRMRQIIAEDRVYTVEIESVQQRRGIADIHNIDVLEEQLLISIHAEDHVFGSDQKIPLSGLLSFPFNEYDWDRDFGRFESCVKNIAGKGLIELYPTSSSNILDHFCSLTSAGRYSAIKLSDRTNPKSFRQRIIETPRSDWITLGAFVVSAIALFK